MELSTDFEMNEYYNSNLHDLHMNELNKFLVLIAFKKNLKTTNNIEDWWFDSTVSSQILS